MPLMSHRGAPFVLALVLSVPLSLSAQSSGFVVPGAEDDGFEETPRAAPARKLPPVARPPPKSPEPEEEEDEEEDETPAPVRERSRGKGMEIIIEETSAPTTIRVGDGPRDRSARASPDPKGAKQKVEPVRGQRSLPLPPPPPPPPAYRDDEEEREPVYVAPEPRRQEAVKPQRPADSEPEPRRASPGEDPSSYAPRSVLPQGKRVGGSGGVAIEEVDLGSASSSFIKAAPARPEKSPPRPTKAIIPPPPPPPQPAPAREEFLLPPAAPVPEPEAPAPVPTPSRRPVRTAPVEAPQPPPSPKPIQPPPPAEPLGEDPFEKLQRDMKELEKSDAKPAPKVEAVSAPAPVASAPPPAEPPAPEAKPSRAKRTKERASKERDGSERPEKASSEKSRREVTPIADPVLQAAQAPRTGVSVGATVGLLLVRDAQAGYSPALSYGLAAALRPVITSPVSFDLVAVRAARTEGTDFVSVASAWIHVAVHVIVSKQWSNGLFLGAGVGPLVTGNSATYTVNDGRALAPVGSQIRFGGDAVALFGVRFSVLELRADLHALLRGGPRLDLMPSLSVAWSR